jgi:uncharacterized protein
MAMLVLALFAAAGGKAQELPATPRDYVVDLAGVVDAATEARLNGYLQELERKTTTQMLVLTVKTTSGVPIRDFALRAAEKWKLGRAKKDNGVLIVVAVDDHKWDIEVGYGLESVLPDAFSGRVGREVLVPSFRKNQYSQGIAQGTLILANKVASDAGVNVSGMPVQRLAAGKQRPPGELGGCCCLGVGVLVLLLVVGGLGRRRQGYRRWGGHSSGGLLTGLILGQMMGGRGHGSWGGSMGGGSWGGGFGGSGGGSFGGGGGGSFGGGGASGGW